MNGIGLREVVALAALAVAAGISVMFLDPSASESKAPPPTMLILGSPPTEAPPPGATPTPPPVAQRLSQPKDGWFTEFYDARGGGQGTLTGQGFLESLELSFPGAPFPDVRDDLWYVRSTARLEVPEGRSEFALEHQGGVRVLVDGKEVANEDSGKATKTLTVRFDHAAGAAEITVEGRDTGGPFLLRWK